MTDTDTNDTEACIAQIGRVRSAGCRIVRLTAQGLREGENLRWISEQVRQRWPEVSLVADVHFMPEVAMVAALYVDKVRINPGNYHDRGSDLDALLERCARRGVSLRIGVNHGSLSPRIVEEYGDTPRGMVASAMEFLERCRSRNFHRVVVSMKSSNTRVMVYAYRMLVDEMAAAGMDYPLHLGVTEAGNGPEGRIKSAAGIGALLCDGIGDTIRVSLTEPPENEIPVAEKIVGLFAGRYGQKPQSSETAAESGKEAAEPGKGVAGNIFQAQECAGLGEDRIPAGLFDPYSYSRRLTDRVGRLGGGQLPLIYSELNEQELLALDQGKIALLEADGPDPAGQWRRMLADMDARGDRRPVILSRCYDSADPETFMVGAAADFGVMFIDGLADGIHLRGPLTIEQTEVDEISLMILQAARARMSRTEFIACPGCGRTLFDLQGTLDAVKSRTSHLKELKIGVMGCIVNGPGEMADADYGYVGAAPGHITLYRGKEPIVRNIPQEKALDELVALIKSDGKWREP